MLETLKIGHTIFSLNCFMKISYDNCAIFVRNCTIIKKKSRVGGIFRVGRVTPILLLFFGLIPTVMTPAGQLLTRTTYQVNPHWDYSWPVLVGNYPDYSMGGEIYADFAGFDPYDVQWNQP